VIAALGLDATEINAGGFLPPVHIPIDDVIARQSARDDYLGVFAEHGVVHPAAKDVRVNENASIYGVLGNRFRRLSPDEQRVSWVVTSTSTSGRRTRPGTSSPSVEGMTPTSGHASSEALHDVDPGMAVNIEHEDVSLGRIEGLEVAAPTLKEAAATLSSS
jgi:hypothetical protein